MKKYTHDSGELLNLVKEWQSTEKGILNSVTGELPKATNLLTKAILHVLRLEAEKRGLVQQMIADALEREAVNLSPEELATLSGYINKHIEAEEKILSRVEVQAENSEFLLPRYLFTYLIADVKNQNTLLRKFDDELKTASIPTSATSKKFGAPSAA